MAEKNDEQRPVMPATATVADLRAALLGSKAEGPTGDNAKADVDNPAEHYVLAEDGETKINAWGEEKGSKEDKQRMAGLGWA